MKPGAKYKVKLLRGGDGTVYTIESESGSGFNMIAIHPSGKRHAAWVSGQNLLDDFDLVYSPPTFTRLSKNRHCIARTKNKKRP